MPGLEGGIDRRLVERKRVGDDLRNENANARAELVGEFSGAAEGGESSGNGGGNDGDAQRGGVLGLAN